MQLSRRGFLTGRRASAAWAGLLDRLRAVAPGGVWTYTAGIRRMVCVRPQVLDTVPQVFALAHDYGVPLCLGVASAVESDTPLPEDSSGCVVLDVGALTACTPVVAMPGSWLAEPGCRLGDLARLGLAQFEPAPPDWTLAHWAAGPVTPWRVGRCADSGVRAVDVLFDDGTIETLGAFGQTNVRALRSARVQRLVPALFQLAQQAEVQQGTQGESMAGYRLDALQPAAGCTLNLSHLMLGHAGHLALPMRWLLVAGAAGPGGPIGRSIRPAAAQPWQVAIRQTFDPDARFGGLAGCGPHRATAPGSKE